MDGVLGGYGHVDNADIMGSEAFLNTLLSERFPNAASANQHHLVALGTRTLSPNLKLFLIYAAISMYEKMDKLVSLYFSGCYSFDRA